MKLIRPVSPEPKGRHVFDGQMDGICKRYLLEKTGKKDQRMTENISIFPPHCRKGVTGTYVAGVT